MEDPKDEKNLLARRRCAPGKLFSRRIVGEADEAQPRGGQDSPARKDGMATAFEGKISMSIIDSDMEGTAMATWHDGQYVTLPEVKSPG